MSIALSERQPSFSDLAAQLRVFRVQNAHRMRATLYYNLPTILEALDIAAATKGSVRAAYNWEDGMLSSPSELKP